jgi:hypothetical protein
VSLVIGLDGVFWEGARCCVEVVLSCGGLGSLK